MKNNFLIKNDALRKLKCQVFDSQIISTELTVDNKAVFENINIFKAKI